MIIVHHLNNSRSHRVVWLLEELDVKYEIIRYQRHPKTKLAPPSMMAIHPLGSSPIITDGEVVLAESGAIIEYILYKYGNERLKPASGTPEWILYIFWLHFAEGSFMPLTLLRGIFQAIYDTSPFFIKPITKAIGERVAKAYFRPKIASQLNYMEDTLAKNHWFAGKEFTAADIQMGISLSMTEVYKDTDADRPHLREFINRIENRPAYIRTLEIAGPIATVLKR